MRRRKGLTGKIMILCLVLVIGLGASGVGLAQWEEDLTVNGTVNTGCWHGSITDFICLGQWPFFVVPPAASFDPGVTEHSFDILRWSCGCPRIENYYNCCDGCGDDCGCGGNGNGNTNTQCTHGHWVMVWYRICNDCTTAVTLTDLDVTIQDEEGRDVDWIEFSSYKCHGGNHTGFLKMIDSYEEGDVTGALKGTFFNDKTQKKMHEIITSPFTPGDVREDMLDMMCNMNNGRNMNMVEVNCRGGQDCQDHDKCSIEPGECMWVRLKLWVPHPQQLDDCASATVTVAPIFAAVDGCSDGDDCGDCHGGNCGDCHGGDCDDCHGSDCDDCHDNGGCP